MADYKLSNTAREDLIRIHQFGVYQFGERQADLYIDSFFEHFELIAQRPYAFESVDFIRVGYRRCICGSDSIFYKIEEGTVEIMTIIGRQDTNKIFK